MKEEEDYGDFQNYYIRKMGQSQSQSQSPSPPLAQSSSSFGNQEGYQHHYRLRRENSSPVTSSPSSTSSLLNPCGQTGHHSNSNKLFGVSSGLENHLQSPDLSSYDYRYGARTNRKQWLREFSLDHSVESVRGQVVYLAKDQHGCRHLQRIMDHEGFGVEDLDVIFNEVMQDISGLVVDPFGNYVVQDLLKICSEAQTTQILLGLTQNRSQFIGICSNTHGARVVQKLLEDVPYVFQVPILVGTINRYAVTLSKSANGHHVVQHCLKNFPDRYIQHILNEVANRCIELAMDKSGCCVLQLCVLRSRGDIRKRLMTDIIANALLLSEDRYGNYVVQLVLGLSIPEVTELILRQLEGNYTSLSFNKFGSNVVEKCLKEAEERQATKIIVELLRSVYFSMLLLDQFGNYVIQSALWVSKADLFKILVRLIEPNSHMMRCNQYGKKVLDKMRKLRMQKM